MHLDTTEQIRLTLALAASRDPGPLEELVSRCVAAGLRRHPHLAPAAVEEVARNVAGAAIRVFDPARGLTVHRLARKMARRGVGHLAAKVARAAGELPPKPPKKRPRRRSRRPAALLAGYNPSPPVYPALVRAPNPFKPSPQGRKNARFTLEEARERAHIRHRLTEASRRAKAAPR